jgi:hypothetical protein
VGMRQLTALSLFSAAVEGASELGIRVSSKSVMASRRCFPAFVRQLLVVLRYQWPSPGSIARSSNRSSSLPATPQLVSKIAMSTSVGSHFPVSMQEILAGFLPACGRVRAPLSRPCRRRLNSPPSSRPRLVEVAGLYVASTRHKSAPSWSAVMTRPIHATGNTA